MSVSYQSSNRFQKASSPFNTIPNASRGGSTHKHQNPLLQHLDLATIKKIKRGAYIYSQSAQDHSIYLVKSGSVKLGTVSANGREITKAILLEGDLFNEKSILRPTQNEAYAIARMNSEVYVFRPEIIQKLIAHDQELFGYFMNIIGQRAIQMERRLEALVFHDSRTRVIDFLLDLAERRGRSVGFETLVQSFMTHQEIANQTATSRQTVTTILNELRNANILTFNRRRLLIRDLNQLAISKAA